LRYVPFNRPWTTGTELGHIEGAIAAGHLSARGAYTSRCTAWLAEATGSRSALLTHSATGALEIAALLADLEPGDEVIVPSFTFVTTASAFALRGAVAVFVDVRPDTLNLDERLLEAAITPRTRAIVPVHYAGVACEMDAIMAIAARHGLLVVEDAAHALTATYEGRPLGSIGDLAALSFHETKNVIAGEAGALLVNRPDLVEAAEIVLDKGTDRRRFERGQVDKYTWNRLGSSFGASDITAAFLWGQLEGAAEITARRSGVWTRYHAAFADLEAAGLLRRPVVPDGCRHNAHMYYLLAPDRTARDRLLSGLQDRGVDAVFHYVPLHSSPAGLRHGRAHGDLAVTDDVSGRLVRLPLWPGMDDEDVAHVVRSVHEVLDRPSAVPAPERSAAGGERRSARRRRVASVGGRRELLAQPVGADRPAVGVAVPDVEEPVRLIAGNTLEAGRRGGRGLPPRRRHAHDADEHHLGHPRRRPWGRGQAVSVVVERLSGEGRDHPDQAIIARCAELRGCGPPVLALGRRRERVDRVQDHERGAQTDDERDPPARVIGPRGHGGEGHRQRQGGRQQVAEEEDVEQAREGEQERHEHHRSRHAAPHDDGSPQDQVGGRRRAGRIARACHPPPYRPHDRRREGQRADERAQEQDVLADASEPRPSEQARWQLPHPQLERQLAHPDDARRGRLVAGEEAEGHAEPDQRRPGHEHRPPVAGPGQQPQALGRHDEDGEVVGQQGEGGGCRPQRERARPGPGQGKREGPERQGHDEREQRVGPRLLRVPDEQGVHGDEARRHHPCPPRRRELGGGGVDHRDRERAAERRERSQADLSGPEGLRPQPQEHVVERRRRIGARQGVHRVDERGPQDVDRRHGLVEPEALAVERGEAQDGRERRQRRDPALALTASSPMTRASRADLQVCGQGHRRGARTSGCSTPSS
jgi:dTDP-4-amino-4,6-dideoxygalactose transaminase